MITEDSLVRWTLEGSQKPHFLTGLAKIYKEINVIGFSQRMGLTRDELAAVNDFIEQLAKDNYEE